MSVQDPSNKVISLSRRREKKSGMSGAKNNPIRNARGPGHCDNKRKRRCRQNQYCCQSRICVYQTGKKVLILDADLGLGNLDVLLGLAPKYNLSHVIMEEKTMEDVLVEGPGNMKILPASSGIQELTQLTRSQKINILTQLDELIDCVDILFN